VTYNASQSFNQALEIFSSLYQDMAPPDVPPGLSPDCQDVSFLPGGVFTRPALNRFQATAQEPSSNTVSVSEFPTQDGDHFAIWLSSLGNLWQEDIDSSDVTQITSFSEGSQFRSINAFGKQFYALYNASLAAAFSDSPFVGTDVPQYYDGQNVWRVTQDAPGGNPDFVNVATAPVDLVETSPTGTATISTVISGGQKIVGWDKVTSSPFYVYTTLTYGCTAPVSASWVGVFVNVTGLTGANANVANINAQITAVVGSSFTVTIAATSEYVDLSAQSGTATVAGNYLTRLGNIVTVCLGTTIPPNFVPGLFVTIINADASAINGPNWTISTISRDATGLVTVSISTSLTNLAEGSQLFINASDTTDFPASLQTVYQVINANTFTISNPNWGNGAVISSSGGSVYQIWSGSFQIQTTAIDANGNALITYFQLGPDISLNSTGGTGTAQLQSQIAPGPRNAVLIFQGPNGSQTAPSVPIQISAVGGTTLLAADQILLGPLGTQKRILAFTAAYGSSYYYISPSIIPSIDGLPPVISIGTIINDNTSTTALIDFSDTQLESSTQIDIQGNNLFNQIVLAPCLGVISYQERVLWWGEINNIKNLVNNNFDGGINGASYAGNAGSGTNGSGGTAWTNPSNITSSSSYANVSLSNTNIFSDQLLVEDFGFSISTVGSITTITFTIAAYIVSTGASFGAVVIATLLKAGVPIGTATSAEMVANTGSAAVPLTLTFSFPASGLIPSDINNTAFGVELQVKYSGGVGTSDVFIRQGQASIVIGTLFPPGWDTAASTGGTGALVSNGTFGFSYQMTGNGGMADCLISQLFYQDYYGDPIGQPNTTYLLRLLIKATGTLAGDFVCDIVSPSQGTLATATLAISGLTGSLAWTVVTFNAELPASVPPDTIVRLYLQGSSAVVTIDEPEFIPQNEPVNFQQMRASYINNEFGYDDVTGILEIDGSAKLTGAFVQRGYLYGLTDGPLFQTQNNGQTEPNGWGFSNFADECDCFGPNAVAFTEDLAWWAGPLSGVRIFNGAKPSKISQEVQPTWELINDNAPLAVWIANDPDQRVLYVGVPTGNNTSPNIVIPMSYRNVGDVANDPAPLRQSLSGKMIPLELCRKWTIWNMPMNCGSMVTQATSVGQKKQMLLGGQTYGNLYWLNPAKFTDDDYGIIGGGNGNYYTTCFFFNHDTEQSAPGLGQHRKLFNFLSLYISGVGQVQITPLVDNLDNPWTITPTVWNALTGAWSAGGPGTFQGTCNTSGDTLTLTSAGNFPKGITGVYIGGTLYNVLSQVVGTLTLATSPGTQTGVAFTALYTPASIVPVPLYPLSQSPTHDLEWPLNVRGERMALKIAAVPLAGQTDAAFNLQHLTIAGLMDRCFPVRGALTPP
jgi:hypothetical protein